MSRRVIRLFLTPTTTSDHTWLKKNSEILKWPIFSLCYLFISGSCGHSINPQMVSSKELKRSLSCRGTHLGVCIASKWNYEAKIEHLDWLWSWLSEGKVVHEDHPHPGSTLRWIWEPRSQQRVPCLTHGLERSTQSEPFGKDLWCTLPDSLKYLPLGGPCGTQAGSLMQE